MTLVLRSTKGSRLTHAEMDGNWEHAVDSANQSFTQSGIGTPVATTVAIKNRERLSLFDFCTDAQKAAIRAGTQTDVTDEFTDAVAEACASGRDLEINEGTPVIAATMTLTKGVRLWGHGMRSLLYVDSAVGASTDILKISPGSAADADVTGYLFENFYLLPVSGTPGRHAIAIDITTRAVHESKFRRLRLNAFGSRGFVTLPNASPLADGFFTSSIEDCVIYNGIYLDKAGDSIRILRNTLPGANAGVYADLVFVSASNKAHGLDIEGNNITTSGGSVHIKSAWAARLTRNIFENSAGNANNALVDIDGTDATNRPDGVEVYRNMFATPSGVDAVRVNYARMAQISMNQIYEPGGGGFAFKVTANAVDTQILYNPTATDSAISTQLSDAGTRTVFMRHGLGGHTELSRDMYLIGSNGKYRGKDTAGTAVAILGISSDDDTVSVGAIDAPATNGHLLFYANGVNWGRYRPDGTFEANRSANGATANIKTATTLLSAVSGASVTATSLIPGGAFILGVATKVTTGLGTSNGTTGYTVGDGTDADRWGAVVGTTTAAESNNASATANPTGWTSLGNNVVITATTGNFDGTGAIRVTAFYLDTTAPAS